MKTSRLRQPVGFAALLLLLALLLPTAALAKGGGERSSKSDKRTFFDSRQTPAAKKTLKQRAAAQADAPAPATEALKDSLGAEGIVSVDPLTGTPSAVGRLDDFLTGASGASAKDIALGYVKANAAAFGLDAATIGAMELARDYVSIDGTHHLFFVQKVQGVPIFGNGLKANVTSDGRLINVLGSPVASPSASSATPGIGAGAAVASARRNVEEGMVPFRSLKGGTVVRKTTFSNGDSASLVFFQSVNGLRLAWQSYISGTAGSYLHVVDAATGAVLYRRSLVNYADALVYENSPGAAKGGTQEQKSISNPGWLTSPTTLSGNNAHVYADVDDSNDSTNVDGEPEEIAPSGGGNWLFPVIPFTFDNPLNSIYGCDISLCTWNPSFTEQDSNGNFGDFSYQANKSQSGAQLFYLVNKFHDHLAAAPYGFTAAAGNFEGADPVNGEALDGANSYGFGYPDPNHTDNANMATLPDGNSPRMQMYLFHDTTTDYFNGPAGDPFLPSDGSNEANIVYHEYTHGLSNRLVVDAFGNSTLGNIQAGAMGEAWSDWYAFDFLVNQGYVTDTAADGELRLGAYTGKNLDLFRTQPVDCPVGTSAAACPFGGYTYGAFGQVIGRPEVHADGEIWAATLWDLRKALGATTTESLVTRAMELSPANPSFLDMRNAILQADKVAHSHKRDAIWAVFANRGMGFYAAATSGDDAAPVEDFSLPPGRHARTGDLKGSVLDADTGKPIAGAVVAFGGHASGFRGDWMAVSKKRGDYKIRKIFTGTYPKVSASGAGYDPSVLTVTIGRHRNTQDFRLRRDWAALGGGGSVFGFNGPDYTGFGCGPGSAIDQSQGSGWGSTTDDDDGNATGNVTPKWVVVQLPQAVNISEIFVNPSATCGDAGSSSTKDYRIETSTNGSSWATVKEGSFWRTDRNYHSVSGLNAGGLAGVKYVRFWMLNPQVPFLDDSQPPFGQSGVPDQCGPGKGNGFTGCQFMDMSELGIYGTPS